MALKSTITIKSNNSIPQHIAIIMDGNGRWAKRRNLGRIDGHRAGVKTVKRIVKACRRLGVKVLTLYAFSKENWNRPREEVDALMTILKSYLKKDIKELMDNNIRIRIIGDTKDLPHDIQASLEGVVNETRENTGMDLVIALSYGGRAEILQAVSRMMDDRIRGVLSRDEINARSFEKYLYTSGLPDPDLLIRTSGEFRISNFLLWQIAYTEIYVTKKLWPDFTKNDLLRAIRDYRRRERRFGLTSEQIKRNNARDLPGRD